MDERGSTRTALVTGPSLGGVGFFTARGLAARGWRVVLAGRRPARLAEAAAAIRAELPGAELDHLVVDLSLLDSVRAAAGRATNLGPLDVLVDNAGVMATPYRRTREGLDAQMATNHWGPFLLTGLLLPQLVASGAGRVVTVSSQMHRLARGAPLRDPYARPGRRYHRWRVYSESKLANLLFTFELDRRLRAAGLPVAALAAHPGLAGTHLVVNGRFGRRSGGLASILDAAMKAVAQSAADGALPVLMAATDDLPGGTYVGPTGPREARGAPGVVGSSPLAGDADAARRLWELSESVVDLRYP
jgi:NAD(P)-dependent dehydrogenase (short-subunit alcohol dehydrogenase family)